LEGLVDPIIPLTMEIIENSLSDFQSECANWYKTDTLSQQASGTGGSNERMTYDIEDVSTSKIEKVTDKMKCCQFIVENDNDGNIKKASMSFHAYGVYEAMEIEARSDVRIVKSAILPAPGFW